MTTWSLGTCIINTLIFVQGNLNLVAIYPVMFLCTIMLNFGKTTPVLLPLEAILYPTVNQWVYQYEGTGFNPETSTVGQQSDSAR